MKCPAFAVKRFTKISVFDSRLYQYIRSLFIELDNRVKVFSTQLHPSSIRYVVKTMLGALVYDEPPSPYVSFKTSADGKKVKVIDNTISIQGPGHPMAVSSYEEIFFDKIMNSKSDMKVYIRTSSYRINFTLPGFNY